MNQPDRQTTIVEGPQTVSHNANEPQPAAQPAADGSFVPPAAEGLPLAALDSATQGANRLDAWAKDPHGRNFLAHALVQLARNGWLRTEPCEGFEPVPESRAVAEPEDFAVQPAADRAALRDRIAAALYEAEYPGFDWRQAHSIDWEQSLERADAVLAVLPEPADRAVVRAEALREAADHLIDVRDRIITKPSVTGQHLSGLERAARELRRLAGEQPAQVLPRRGDAFERWLKTQRDEHRDDDRGQWSSLDDLLDRYRLHADTRTPLGEHVCEGRVAGDCECLEQPVPDPQPVSDEFLQQLATAKVREDATVDPAMCPRCKGDNSEAFELCARCASEQPAQDEAPKAEEPPPVCQGFVWIGQSFATCDRCGQPAWEHAGVEEPVERGALFDDRVHVRPWKPGEADAIRAKWGTPSA